MIPVTATRLILLEGIPGSGKSSAGTFLQSFLEKEGLAVRFWREGDFDHPADFEGVARLSPEQVRDLYRRHPQLVPLFEEQSTVRGADDHLLKYRKLQHMYPQKIPQALIDELSRYDVYDGLPMEEFCRLALDRWHDFRQAAEQSQAITILECCFLQNPLTVMLARHNADPEAARRQILEISQKIEPLAPLVIYLRPRNVRATLEHVREERPKEWADFVTGYLTEQAYGKAHRIQGYEGVIRFYEMRQKLEEEILPTMPIRSRVIEHDGSGWDRNHDEILGFLRHFLRARPI